jgi:hypothetical protein
MYQGWVTWTIRRGFGLVLDLFALKITVRTDYNCWEQFSTGRFLNPLGPCRSALLRAPISLICLWLLLRSVSSVLELFLLICSSPAFWTAVLELLPLICSSPAFWTAVLELLLLIWSVNRLIQKLASCRHKRKHTLPRIWLLTSYPWKLVS